MKKLYTVLAITCLLLTIAFVVSGQPKLVGVLGTGGPKLGGSLFRVDLPATTPSFLYEFDHTAPHNPTGGVIAADGDWLYGRILYAGEGQFGGIYKIRRDGTGFTLLASFTTPAGNLPLPYYHTDGSVYYTHDFNLYKLDVTTHAITSYPLNGEIISRNMLIDADNWLYGTTSINRLVKIKTDGTQWTDVYQFVEATDGSFGLGMTEIPGDSLFGIHQYGGSDGGGTIYSIKKDGTAFAVHHHFTNATGFRPQSKLIYFDGRLFGTTNEGGDNNSGVLFTINTDGTGYRVLHHFATGTFSTGGIYGNISIASNGRIFGGFYQFFSLTFPQYRLFKMDTSGAGFEPFLQVDQREHGHFNQDVLLLNDEDIYLVTREMGRHEGGTLSYSDSTGAAGALYQFGVSATGFRPRYGLIRGRTDNKLYGVADVGGSTGNGIIYSINQNGTGYLKLHEFADNEGYEPSGKLLEASDGRLYGVLQYGGGSNTGAIYRVDKNGSNFQVLYNFSNFAEGYWPRGHLIEDENGVLYGTVSLTSGDRGGVYRINKDGTGYTLLHSFPFTDINTPMAGLYLRGDRLYGTCAYGNAENKGGIFRIRRNGQDFEVLHSFSGPNDGANPMSSLILATNGKLYSNTTMGGIHGEGTVFSIDTTGANYAILRNFSNSVDGSYLQDQLIQASDLAIYGSTFSSNINPGGGGSIFKMNLDGSGFATVLEFSSEDGQTPYSLLDLNGMYALPVDLLTFNAQKKDRTVLVSWKTSREHQSHHFEVERSGTGNSFRSVGSIAATGTAGNYSFTDQLPLKGNNFYRLKMVDADGSFTYSRIVSLNFNNTGSIVLSPNPAPGRLYVQLPSGHNYSMLDVIDVSGKQVLQKNIASAITGLYLDIQHLPAGRYVLRLRNGDTTEQTPFIKQ